MRFRLLAVVVAAAALSTAVVTSLPPSPPTSAAAQAGCLASLGLPNPGPSLPLLLVHGFTGDPGVFGDAREAIEATPLDVRMYPFDYSDVADEWVDHGDIGPRLREWIVCLSDASQAQGGPGRVAVLAHSMGGLATRFAAGGDLGDRIALVGTMGTPHQGSPFTLPGTALAGVAADAVVDRLDDVLAPQLSSPAIRAMAPGSSQLQGLAAWPPGVPVWSGAGEYIAEQRFLFFNREAGFGDVLVGRQSATASAPMVDQLGGPDVVECRVPVPLDLDPATASALVAYAFASDPSLRDCYHGRLPSAARMLDPFFAQLAASLNRPPRGSLQEVDFQNVTLPAGSCRYGNWTNPLPIPLSGGTGESGTLEGDSASSVLSLEVVGFADFDGDGGEEALLAVECSGSPLDLCCAGTGSIDTFGVVVHGDPDQLELLGEPITATYGEDGIVTVDSVALDGTTVITTERYGFPGEADCCRSGTRTVSWTWDGSGWSGG